MSENPDKYGVFWYNEQEINHWRMLILRLKLQNLPLPV